MKVNHLRLKARDFLPFPEWDIKLNKVIGMKSPRGKPRGIIRFGYFLSSRSKLQGIRPSGD